MRQISQMRKPLTQGKKYRMNWDSTSVSSCYRVRSISKTGANIGSRGAMYDFMFELEISTNRKVAELTNIHFCPKRYEDFTYVVMDKVV